MDASRDRSFLTWARGSMCRLQGAMLSDNRYAVSWARRHAAELRRSFGTPCGSVPLAAEISLRDMPGRRFDGWDDLERASWAAFALMALHMQGASRNERVQVNGVPVADAVAALVASDPNMAAHVRRLGKARGVDEAARMFRPLLDGMRDRVIPCDHAALALFLRDFADPTARRRAMARLV